MVYKRNILLYPFSLIYGAVTGIRNFMYNSGILPMHNFSLPVICVGNITVGGTGKTPHTEYLIDILKDNFRVATLSRGYKRESSGFRLASPEMKVSEIGDEPMQIIRKYPDITVAVDRDRVHGVKSILKEKPETEVIILDDGFQHRSITPGFTILLTDFNRLMNKDYLLPYGELRENFENMYRADIILITKSPEKISPIQRRIIIKEINKAPYQNLYFTSICYLAPQPLFSAASFIENIFFHQGKEKQGIVLVTGIANPFPMKEYLDNFFSEIIHLSFSDHHKFNDKDIKKISEAFEALGTVEKWIITSEKDAVRLREFSNFAEPIRKAFYYVPVGVNFLNNAKAEFDNIILDYVRKNKRNNRISESQGL
jgi:tetraacyldisaccharide 4'-kinase